MIRYDISDKKVIDVIDVICDKCGCEFERTIKNLKNRRKTWNGEDVCIKCSYKLSANKKPQCSKEYWENIEVKEKHSKKIKNSEKYKTAIENREDIFGEKNPMYGKKHKPETIKKMSVSRTGKIGENSTAWKGGKMSITRLVKGFQYRNGWYKKIYVRDYFKCVVCGSNHKIEAHHKTPIKNIIDLYKDNFDNNDDLYNFIIKLDIIIDENLENGITLCRNCHKKEHINFGSHKPVVLKYPE